MWELIILYVGWRKNHPQDWVLDLVHLVQVKEKTTKFQTKKKLANLAIPRPSCDFPNAGTILRIDGGGGPASRLGSCTAGGGDLALITLEHARRKRRNRYNNEIVYLINHKLIT